MPGRRRLWGTLWKGPGQPDTEPGKNGKKAGSGLDFQHGCFPGHAAEGTGPGTPVHVIPGNVSSTGSAKVHEWLRDRPDRIFHFNPAPASWTDAVEGFLPELTGQRLKDAVLDPLDGCVAAMEGYIGHHNASDARPFRWSRNPEDPVASCRRGHRRLGEMAEAESPA